MFLVFLRFSTNKAGAPEHMKDHSAWIKRGFDDGVFLLVGSLQSGSGGGIVAHNTSASELRDRVNADPFVAHDVVSAEVIELTPSKVDPRLNFLVS